MNLGDKLNWIEQVIKETNKGIDEYDRMAQKEEIQRQTLWEEKARVERMRDVLRRTFAPI